MEQMSFVKKNMKVLHRSSRLEGSKCYYKMEVLFMGFIVENKVRIVMK